MCDEGRSVVDPLHNRYINVIRGESSDESSSDSEDESESRGKGERLFVPSDRFIFLQRDTCKSTLFTVDHSLLSEATDRIQAECILFAIGNDELYDTLRVLQRLSEYQDVSAKTFVIDDV